jgi:hypothetical protein
VQMDRHLSDALDSDAVMLRSIMLRSVMLRSPKSITGVMKLRPARNSSVPDNVSY